MLGIFLDTETTGLSSYKHALIEIAFKIVDLRTGQQLVAYESIVKQSWDTWNKKDPNSIKINGFTWEQISLGKEPKQVGDEIIEILTAFHIQRGNAVFICQNPSFDRGFFNQVVDVYIQESLNWPYHWLDFASMFWVLYVKQLREAGLLLPDTLSLSKNDIATLKGLPPESSPHRAIHGVDHLLLCYEKVVGFNMAF